MNYPGYTVVRQEPCPEQHGTLTILAHDLSGATVLLVENEDTNKAFGIGFGTFPSDDTGVFHILEHSVLAGSEKYPVTSPFLQLLKSSMASFLNAMTFPDKTVYPFATPNETDFKNLMDVYLNAVFCPLAMVDKAVFEQEGWHRSDRKVLARVMSYEYLWHSIREVGGAYGTGMLSSDGVEYLYTYRDPHVKESYDTFAKGPAELAAREYTEKDLNDFIVGAAAKLDTPRKPRAEAREIDRRYFCGITDEMVSADRRALCAVDAALLKEQAAELGAAMANGVRVVFGSKDAVEAAKDLFDTVETL